MIAPRLTSIVVLSCLAGLCASCGIYGEYVARSVEDRVASSPATLRLILRGFLSSASSAEGQGDRD